MSVSLEMGFMAGLRGRAVRGRGGRKGKRWTVQWEGDQPGGSGMRSRKMRR